MKRLLAAFLTATFLISPTPAYARGSRELAAGNGAASSSRSHALRAKEFAETGLEEEFLNALRSPDDLVHAAGTLASTALGLNPSIAVHPELVEGERPSRRAGLEEDESAILFPEDHEVRRYLNSLLLIAIRDGVDRVNLRLETTSPESSDLVGDLFSGPPSHETLRRDLGQVRVSSSREFYDSLLLRLKIMAEMEQRDLDLDIQEGAFRLQLDNGPVEIRLTVTAQPHQAELASLRFYFHEGRPMGNREEPAAGLEEGVRVMMMEELARMRDDAGARALALELAREKKAGVVLLPKATVDASDLVENASPPVEIYAHPSVSEWIPYWLPSGWGLYRETQLLKDGVAQANFQLAKAAKSVDAGRTVIVAVDRDKREGLELPRGVILLLNPETIKGIDPRIIAAFLSQARGLTHLILDLTSGSIRTVTIGDTEYYALEIAA